MGLKHTKDLIEQTVQKLDRNVDQKNHPFGMSDANSQIKGERLFADAPACTR